MSKILSIVVPAYNVERELEKCIESCLKQDIPQESYEIIIVNDGATDNTLQVATDIAAKYECVSVVNQKNMGLSGARNTGLKYAKGKYVWFIDSDDYIKPNVLGNMIRQADDNNLDCLFFRLQRVFDDESFRSEVDDYECVQPSVTRNTILSGREAILQGYNPSSVCAILFNVEFLQKHCLQFMLGIYHEDAEFTYRMISKTQRIMFIADAPYLYFTHAGTMTRSKNINSLIKNRVDDITVAQSYLKLAQELKDDGKLSTVITRRAKSILFGLLWEMWLNRKEWSKNGINDTITNKMEEECLYPLRSPYGSFKQAILSIVLLNNKCLFKI
ncbi:glycosyltransferase [Prevotella sp.]|uniref:glycosyltransferase n=1 Tax=Prevotella sp. TaxID=59823 RepID=UPI003F800931